MITPTQENARMLASLVGIAEDEATERLDRTVVVTTAAEPAPAAFADELERLLERTIGVTRTPSASASLEVVVGGVAPRTGLSTVHVGVGARRVLIDRVSTPTATAGEPHPLFAAIAACHAAAAVLGAVLDDPALPRTSLPTSVAFDELGIPASALSMRIDLSGAVLIGAGAVGHGLLRALRHLDVGGRLAIVDPKTVGGGNANRCLYLDEADTGSNKAEALAGRAGPDRPHLTLRACVEDFSSYARREGPPPTVFVTVDSRRVRRSIQKELPGRVLDGSTTDVRAVVVHSHRQPTRNACMACIYRHVPDENARERSIAEGLGVDLAAVAEGRITAAAAARIVRAHPSIDPAAIVGVAYDSLFKQLCAAQALATPEGRQVLAPFAFVSSLAGALLAIELLRSQAGLAATNYWSVDPWGRPIGRIRRLLPRHADCEFCSRPESAEAAERLWGGDAVEDGNVVAIGPGEA